MFSVYYWASNWMSLRNIQTLKQLCGGRYSSAKQMIDLLGIVVSIFIINVQHLVNFVTVANAILATLASRVWMMIQIEWVWLIFQMKPQRIIMIISADIKGGGVLILLNWLVGQILESRENMKPKIRKQSTISSP